MGLDSWIRLGERWKSKHSQILAVKWIWISTTKPQEAKMGKMFPNNNQAKTSSRIDGATLGWYEGERKPFPGVPSFEKHPSVGQKWAAKMEPWFPGNMDEHLRFAGALTLTHTHDLDCVK